MQIQAGRNVVVVGGGLAGLSAAIFAARGGARVEVLDAAEALGGRARSREHEGYCFNQGAHALYRGGPGMVVLRELGVSPDGVPPPLDGAYALRGERLRTLPTGPLSLLTTGLLSLPERLQLVRVLGGLGRIDLGPLQSMTLDAWLHSTLWPDAAELIRSFVRLATFSDAADRISAGAALAQLTLAQQGVLYVHGGWQSLVDQLTSRAQSEGVILRERTRVVSVARAASGLLVEVAGGEQIAARAVVLAVTPQVAAELVPQAKLPALETVRVACLDVALRRLPRPTQRFVLGIDRPLYLSVHSPGARLAPEGGALVHLMRYLGSAEEARAEEFGELERLLERVQPGWTMETVHRRALPSMTVAHALPTAAMGGFAGRPDVDALGMPGVFLAGDWVGPEGFLADASLASGRRAAAACGGQTVSESASEVA